MQIFVGKNLSGWDECEEHEQSHLLRLSVQAETKEVIETLRYLGECAYGYHVGNLVAGIPVSNFTNLVEEVARRLEVDENHLEKNNRK